MIHYISGTIVDIQQNTYLVVANTVGYEIAVPHNYSYLAEQSITLFVYPHLTQDHYQLFGFQTRVEKQWFMKLISISGIGPKTGLQIISKDIHALEKAIVDQNKEFFESVSGIGKKTALKLLIELVEKPFVPTSLRPATPFQEAVQTLIELGFKEDYIRNLLADPPKNATAGQLVSLALKSHAQKNSR
ncbi:MAG: Holliday junction branch migration protein RuvA [Candidatus Abawacabacteria bacterium]|nr:Holliday junction branch migration protein RuvA [Candidatus Abawacabacteria bacterium]